MMTSIARHSIGGTLTHKLDSCNVVTPREVKESQNKKKLDIKKWMVQSRANLTLQFAAVSS